jgi:hypothetical protein
LSKGLSSESDDELVITTLTSLRDICKQVNFFFVRDLIYK